MKIPPVSTKLFLLLFSGSILTAGEITFKSGEEARDYVLEPGKNRFLSIEEGPESQGLLTFRADAGGGIATLKPDQQDLITAADEVEIEFRTEGRVTFAIFLRGQGAETFAYVAFLGASSGNNLSLYLCKASLASSLQPSQTALVYKSTKNYQSGDWYKLRLKLGNEDGKTTFAGELSEAQTSQNLIELVGEDADTPITDPGQITFRFFADRSQGGGSVQIKRVAITP